MSLRILVTGASGQLGGYLLRELASSGPEVVAWSGSRAGDLCGFPLRPVNLADADAVTAAFRQAAPSAVLHAGAVATVAECWRNPAHAQHVNARGSAVLADLCEQAGARLVLVSTDLVFDGERGGYGEQDQPAPLSAYGRTKWQAEQPVLTARRSAVVRMSLLYGPTLTGRPSFFDQQLAALRERRPLTLFEDEWRTPLDLATAARALVELVRSDYEGLLHVGGPERMSRLEMGMRLAAALRADPSIFVAQRRDQVAAPEPRPRDTSLESSRWRALFPAVPWPAWTDALRELAVIPPAAAPSVTA
jgi:dTDP-4-dehydrorhamnose reductase